jgi:hypothetical protein
MPNSRKKKQKSKHTGEAKASPFYALNWRNEVMKTTMPVTIQSETRFFFTCPVCDDDEEHQVDHLFGRLPNDGSSTTFGPWYCRKCQHRFNGTLKREPDTSVSLKLEIEELPEDEHRVEGYVLLRSSNSEGDDPIYIIAHDNYLGKHRGADRDGMSSESRKEYWYDEHTCPTKWTRNIVALIRNTALFVYQEDTDPHGVFHYVKHYTRDEITEILATRGLKLDSLDHMGGIGHREASLLFPEIFVSEKPVIEGSLSRPGLPGPGPLLIEQK